MTNEERKEQELSRGERSAHGVLRDPREVHNKPTPMAVHFSRATDEWSTPQALYDELSKEFSFGIDVAATRENCKTLLARYLGPDNVIPSWRDALTVDWWNASRGQLGGVVCWMNPPYSRCREFIAKAAREAHRGVMTVALVPSRTDTRWWHEHVWDRETNQPRPGVEVRFIKGRLKFGASTNSAPFPSVVVIFRPVP